MPVESFSVNRGAVTEVPALEGADQFFRLFEITYAHRPSLFGAVETKTPEEVGA